MISLCACGQQTKTKSDETKQKQEVVEPSKNKAINETHNIASMIEDIDIGLNKGNFMPKIECPKQFKNNL